MAMHIMDDFDKKWNKKIDEVHSYCLDSIKESKEIDDFLENKMFGTLFTMIIYSYIQKKMEKDEYQTKYH